MNAITKEQDHGYQNAQGWAESIASMVAALECDYDRKDELLYERNAFISEADDKGVAATVFDATDDGKELIGLMKAASIDGDEQIDADAVRERIQEAPLSVDVRTGWNNPGAADVQPEEFCILLSTGGPALRIRGELDRGMQPRRAWLEYQDWGTPWTEYHGEGCTGDDLLTFCSQFYFGEPA